MLNYLAFFPSLATRAVARDYMGEFSEDTDTLRKFSDIMFALCAFDDSRGICYDDKNSKYCEFGPDLRTELGKKSLEFCRNLNSLISVGSNDYSNQFVEYSPYYTTFTFIRKVRKLGEHSPNINMVLNQSLHQFIKNRVDEYWNEHVTDFVYTSRLMLDVSNIGERVQKYWTKGKFLFYKKPHPVLNSPVCRYGGSLVLQRNERLGVNSPDDILIPGAAKYAVKDELRRSLSKSGEEPIDFYLVTSSAMQLVARLEVNMIPADKLDEFLSNPFRYVENNIQEGMRRNFAGMKEYHPYMGIIKRRGNINRYSRRMNKKHNGKELFRIFQTEDESDWWVGSIRKNYLKKDMENYVGGYLCDFTDNAYKTIDY